MNKKIILRILLAISIAISLAIIGYNVYIFIFGYDMANVFVNLPILAINTLIQLIVFIVSRYKKKKNKTT